MNIAKEQNILRSRRFIPRSATGLAWTLVTACAAIVNAGPPSSKLSVESNSQVRDAVAQIVSEADAGKDTGPYITSTADLGIDAAIECARHIEPGHDARNAALLEVISLAGQSRRSNGELLKLYDPSAYRLYYEESGKADQQLIGKALSLTTWPSKLPDAMVHAAPAPTIAWMREQGWQEHPRIPELILIWRTWGFWARVGHERQYDAELDAVTGELNASAAITGDPQALPALLRFAGETHARRMESAIVGYLKTAPAPARAEAASACGRLASRACAEAIIEAAQHENDPSVQQKIAMAAEAWPDRAETGTALLKLFNRTTAAAVRREILFSCSRANWPDRGDLLLRGFEAPDDGVLGAALLALSVKPEPTAVGRMLEVAGQTSDAEPPLIDALAASGDSRATPYLIRWLAKQDNPVVRVKLLLALEKTANHEADALLLKILSGDSSAMTVEQTIGIIARKRVPGCEEQLISLALDPTAPIQMRIEAIWAMGRFDTPAIRQTLDKLDRHGDQFFKSPVDANGKPAFSESLDTAKMMVALSKIQLKDPDGDEKLQQAFDRGTATSQLTALVMLAQTGHDHPIIAHGLATADTAIIFGAARAAMAANPKKYHDRLLAIRHAPFMEALLDSGLDSANLKSTLDAAITAGEGR